MILIMILIKELIVVEDFFENFKLNFENLFDR